MGEVGECAYETWCIGLDDYTLDQIGAGIDKVIKKDIQYPPTLKQFQSLCKRSLEDLGVPSMEDAYKQVCVNLGRTDHAQNWRHPVVYWAYVNTGRSEFNTLTEKQIKPIFKKNYQILVDKLMDGKDVGELPRLLPEKIKRWIPPTDEQKIKAKRSLDIARRNLV
jgi:hypothetical protein